MRGFLGSPSARFACSVSLGMTRLFDVLNSGVVNFYVIAGNQISLDFISNISQSNVWQAT
jgi:hypothetical protein